MRALGSKQGTIREQATVMGKQVPEADVQAIECGPSDKVGAPEVRGGSILRAGQLHRLMSGGLSPLFWGRGPTAHFLTFHDQPGNWDAARGCVI